jgi:hypothetical protein
MQKQDRKQQHVPYKYRLLEYLNKLPHERHKLVMRRLPIAVGVHRTTFNDWLYIKADATKMIPADHLVKLATFFDVTVEEMYTSPVKSINYEKLVADFEKEKSAKFNVEM